MLMVDGYRKALKMTKSKLYKLTPSKSKINQKLDKKLISNNKKNIFKIIKIFKGRLIHNCQDIKNFTGRDIDVFSNEKTFLNRKIKDSIIRNTDDNSFRIYLNDKKKINFLSIDIENLNQMSWGVKKVFLKNYNKKIYCNYTKLHHLDRESIIFYKLVKYFKFGTIHSFNQLLILKKEINNLRDNDKKFLISSINNVMPHEKKIINDFIFFNFKKFEKNKSVHNFFYQKRLKRQKERMVFSGRLNFKKIIFKKKFLYALVFGSKKKWRDSHNPMPAIAVVGNDGSGKTTIINYIEKNFSKMDPLIFDMKASKPFFSFTKIIRNVLKTFKKTFFCKNFQNINFLISIIGEITDLTDKYFKYKIGMAWADAGYGITIFERYPTDRIRGEFPNKNNKLLPLEQFFPFPDGLVYIDVLPKDSVRRKHKDKHSIQEMVSKRKNYISLLKEFDEVEKISQNNKLEEKIKKIKNYIFKIYDLKKKNLKKNGRPKRVFWKKNLNRILAGKNLNKSQKESFFD